MKKLALIALAMMTVGSGCDSTTTTVHEEESAPTDGVTAQQLNAFGSLKTTTQLRWRWLQHEALKTPLHLSAERLGPAILTNGDAVKTTLSVLRQNKALFKMRDPDLELSETATNRDEMGMTHARFQQLAHGVPVSGAELMAHYDRDGHLTSIDANYVADLDSVDVQPAFGVEDALASIKKDIAQRTSVSEDLLRPDGGKLVVWTSMTNPNAAKRVAYEYKVRALENNAHPAIWVTTIDAKTGEVLERYDNLQTIEGQGSGVLGDTKKFQVSTQGNGFVLSDTSAATQIRTFSAAQQEIDGNGTAVTSANQNSWDTNVPGAGAAVDAHAHAATVFKYYKDKHARNALDGAGGPLLSTVHYGKAFDNAAWDGTRMIYGDGDVLFKALSVGLDVVGHEFTHGVTEKTSNLTYKDQSGALNEAVSDIFGAFIEHSVQPDPQKNWIMGEVVVKKGTALRNMMNPHAVDQQQPAHMKEFFVTQQDNGGVHINSGIVNNAAWLMTVGGVNPVSKQEVKFGIGWEKSEKLWYRANTKYFIASTNFGQAAQGVLQAAKDIQLTENEINIVDCAFKATGIAQGTCATLIDPQAKTPAPTAPGDDETGKAPGSGDDDEDADEETETKPKPKTRKKVVTTQTSACNASSSHGTSDSDTSLLIVAIGGLVLSLRRRRSPAARA